MSADADVYAHPDAHAVTDAVSDKVTESEPKRDTDRIPAYIHTFPESVTPADLVAFRNSDHDPESCPNCQPLATKR